MDRPSTLINRSISNLSDDSSLSFSVSTIGSKLSNADSYYIKKKNSLSTDPSKYSNSNPSNKCKKKKMRRKTDLRDRLAVSNHASDSNLKRATRLGLDRQLSISRWMADAVTEQCGKIRRTVSSHETLQKEATPELEEGVKRPSLRIATPLKLFQRAESQRSLSKPVRKRSCGPEGFFKDVMRALSGHEKNISGVSASSTKDTWSNLDDNDIEIDTDDDVEFHSDHEDLSTLPDPSPPGTPTTEEPLLKEQSSRWDANSPSREEKKDVSPFNRLVKSMSSRKMPIPPPPPFSPANSNSNLVPPSDLFASGSTEGGTTPCMPLRVTSSHLPQNFASRSAIVPPLSPSDVASAAIAIATDYMGEAEEETEGLNDVVPKQKKDKKDAPSNEDQESFQGYSDEEYSVDVSMLSASNTTFTSFTGTTNQNNNKSLEGIGSSGLAAYMNWAKRRQEEEKDLCKDKNDHDTLSYKSFAEDTFDTFATIKGSTGQKNIPLPLRACSDHHPVLNVAGQDPRMVPPSMPTRSVSNHEKLDVVQRTPKSSKANVSALPTEFRALSPPGDRVQRLLEANKRKCKFIRQSSVKGTFDSEQRFPRRVSLDNATHSPVTPMTRRRASLDVSLLSYTPAVTNTPRTTDQDRKHLPSDLQSNHKTPVSTRNLSSAGACLKKTTGSS